MSPAIEVIAYHGWGFDASCWHGWKGWFADRQIPLRAFDRGYFGAAAAPVFHTDAYCLGMVHSYGLHLCPPEQFQRMDGLVIFNSFLDFHPPDPRGQRRSQRIVHQMIQECQQHPQTVLQQFYARCDYPLDQTLTNTTRPDNLQVDRLVTDLKNLNQAHWDGQLLKKIPTILIFQGLTDQIVPAAKGDELFELLIDNAEYLKIPDGGHALPFTHASVCWDILSEKFLSFSSQ